MNPEGGKRKAVLAVFEWHHLGDAVLSFPFIKSADQSYEVHVFCRPEAEALYRLLLPPGRIHPGLPDWCVKDGIRVPPWTGMTGCAGVLERIRAVNPEVGVCAWVDPRVFSLMTRAGIPRRTGFPFSRNNYFTWEASLTRYRGMQVKLYETAASVVAGARLVTDLVERPDYHQARWKDWQQIGAKLGVSVSCKPPWFELPPEAAGTVVLPQKQAGKITWLIHPGARQEIKRWSQDRFVELIREHVLPSGAGVMLIDPPEGGLSLPELAGLMRVTAPDLRQLAQLISLADGVLCHDSLPAHLAAGLGRPVVTLFGDMPACWFAPFGNEELVVSTRPETWPQTREQLKAKGRTLLDRVTVESVRDRMRKVENIIPA